MPVYVWVLVLAGVLGIIGGTVAALYRGALAARLPRRGAAGLAVGFGALWGAWLVVSWLAADAGGYRQQPGRTGLGFALAIVGPAIAALLATRLPVVARALAAPGTAARLAAPQAARVAGGVFLIVLALGDLPPVFALPAGLGDIAVGVAAPFVARWLARNPDAARRGAVWFNVLGILDLIVALTIGFLAAPGPGRVIASSPPTAALGLLPLALIPAVAVPLALALHIVSLRRLTGAHP